MWKLNAFKFANQPQRSLSASPLFLRWCPEFEVFYIWKFTSLRFNSFVIYISVWFHHSPDQVCSFHFLVFIVQYVYVCYIVFTSFFVLCSVVQWFQNKWSSVLRALIPSLDKWEGENKCQINLSHLSAVVTRWEIRCSKS